MPRNLWLKLVLPLTLLSALSLLVHRRWEAGGFFINLTTELIGIVVTVLYVDWVLRRHEAERWKGTDARIRERLNKHAVLVVTNLRVSLGFGPDILDEEALLAGTGDYARANAEMRRVAVQVLTPAVRSRIEKLTQEEWRNLEKGLRGVWQGAGLLLDRFGSRLSPNEQERSSISRRRRRARCGLG